MPTARRPGMDHDIYRYSPLPERSGLSLPGGKPVAVYIVLHIEHWELFQPQDAHRDPRFKGEFGTFDPDYRNWSIREYGNRVGLWRILELLGQFEFPVTAAVGATALEAHPEIADAISASGFEVVAHGLSVNRMITSKMGEAEEREHIRLSRKAIVDNFGLEPRGWLGQDFGTTPNTSRLLAEEGFEYTLDWANDEQPYFHLDGRLVALPAPSEWDDVQTLALRKVSVDRFPRLVADGLDELTRSGTGNARVMAIGIHPWFFGAPHRIIHLRHTLQEVNQRPEIYRAHAGEIAQLFRQQRPMTQETGE